MASNGVRSPGDDSQTPTYQIVLMRHGESAWNNSNKFCGWHNADLSPTGELEAKRAGKALRDRGFTFSVAYTSVLSRAIKSLYHIQDALDLHWIPVHRCWRLNERMYGDLQGRDKKETARAHGEDVVKVWRRSYDVQPPPLEGGTGDPRWPGLDPRYRWVDPRLLPLTECLKDVVHRVLVVWHDAIVPALLRGERVLVVAHGSGLRALRKYLEGISDDDVMGLNIPTGIPLVYTLGPDLRPIAQEYLADEATVKAAVDKVANQASLK